ncbi:hypothetical protein DAI22_10g133901 [Oryza sativa Japonica Group]|nr:hypothetical protein DAI22_10g133901 [Oryza sativa Japonica Group]
MVCVAVAKRRDIVWSRSLCVVRRLRAWLANLKLKGFRLPVHPVAAVAADVTEFPFPLTRTDPDDAAIAGGGCGGRAGRGRSRDARARAWRPGSRAKRKRKRGLRSQKTL